jgi:hypothetical protein
MSMTDAASRAAAWLSMAAAPTFALMAVATGLDDGAAGMMHAMAHDPSPLTGMTAMYVLMSVFHVGPWLRFVARRRGRCSHRSRADACGRPPPAAARS